MLLAKHLCNKALKNVSMSLKIIPYLTSFATNLLTILFILNHFYSDYSVLTTLQVLRFVCPTVCASLLWMFMNSSWFKLNFQGGGSNITFPLIRESIHASRGTAASNVYRVAALQTRVVKLKVGGVILQDYDA